MKRQVGLYVVGLSRFLGGFSLKNKAHAYSLTVCVTEGFVFNVKPSVGDYLVRMEVDCDRVTVFSVSVAFRKSFTVSSKAKVRIISF